MEKKPTVKIRLYRGRELNYDAKGVIKNENNLVSLEHNTLQWRIFMSNIAISGYCKAEVESAWSLKDGEYESIKDLSSFQKEVDIAFKPKQDEMTQSPEAKRIADLEAKLEFLMSQSKKGGVQTKDIEVALDEVKEEVKDKVEKEVVEDDVDVSSVDAGVEGYDEKDLPKDVIMSNLREQYEELYDKKPFGGWKEKKLREMIAKKINNK